jgi:hypothetical protein
MFEKVICPTHAPKIPLSSFRTRYPPVICSYKNVKSVGSYRVEKAVVARVVGGPNELDQRYAPRAIYEHDQSLRAPEKHYKDTGMNPLLFQARSLLQNKTISSRKENPAGACGQLRRQGKTRKYTTEEGQAFDYVRFCLNPYLLPRRGTVSAYGCPEAFDGRQPIIVQPLPPIPIHNTGRNAELFHFCKHITLYG